MRLRPLIVALLLALLPASARLEDKPPAAPQQTANTLPVGLEQALYLIRSTLLTLNDANRSGNYTVLRDLAAPDFQTKNTAAELGAVFADLRRSKIDLFPVALLGPQLSTAPYLDPSKMLRLTGYFPTRPLQINFDLSYQAVSGQWRLYSIAVATPAAAPEQAQQTPPPAAPKRKSEPPKRN